MCFICVDNKDFCELQSLALVMGREIFDITLHFLLCSLFSLSLSHTHMTFPYKDIMLGLEACGETGSRKSRASCAISLQF